MRRIEQRRETRASTTRPRTPVVCAATSAGSAGLLALQRSIGNQAVAQLVQRRPGAVVQRLKRTISGQADQPMAIDKMDYSELQKLRMSYKYKEIDPHFDPDIVFEAGDIEAINQRLAELEPKQGAVLCSEGQVKVVKPGQEVNYGDVTTCLTVTCVLDDNTKVVAHDGLQLRVPGGIVAKVAEVLKAKELAGKKIASVDAFGVSDTWTTDLEPVDFMAAQPKTSIANSRSGFENYLSSHLPGTPKVTFRPHERGAVKFNQSGQSHLVVDGKVEAAFGTLTDKGAKPAPTRQSVETALRSDTSLQGLDVDAALEDYLARNPTRRRWIASEVQSAMRDALEYCLATNNQPHKYTDRDQRLTRATRVVKGRALFNGTPEPTVKAAFERLLSSDSTIRDLFNTWPTPQLATV